MGAGPVTSVWRCSCCVGRRKLHRGLGVGGGGSPSCADGSLGEPVKKADSWALPLEILIKLGGCAQGPHGQPLRSPYLALEKLGPRRLPRVHPFCGIMRLSFKH